MQIAEWVYRDKWPRYIQLESMPKKNCWNAIIFCPFKLSLFGSGGLLVSIRFASFPHRFLNLGQIALWVVFHWILILSSKWQSVQMIQCHENLLSKLLDDRYNDIVSIINLATDLLTSRPRSIILHASSCRGPEILWKNLLSNVAKSSQFFLLRSQFSDEHMRNVDPIVRRFEWSSFYRLKYARYSDNVYTHFGRHRRDLRRWSIVASPSP